MHTSKVELEIPLVSQVAVTEDSLSVELEDGRALSVPLAWFPRLVHGNRTERDGWRLIGKGLGIHWESLDEDISVENLLAGKPSGESQKSFEKWLAARPSRSAVPGGFKRYPSSCSAEIAALESRRDKTRLLKQGMMQELLTEKTRLV